ncbi:GNAT family N-acetyltransferase [Amnibacterium kyonggiense]|uniref:Acetyltransferase (GNAT) family protein n=1 Tax=Amnibacterium kyonggiense TaxID=595671 RepID=A0A4R7FLZ4_9MICO|nr:GNAT family N-acetyltransferase [Amnibacterium kyonggiense]TDS77455.1 acetyltransferase (GNAT) family protein [Amnibacterium kyonggiense]
MLTDLPLPAPLDTRDGALTLRRASAADLDALVALLSDDAVSATRGDVADPADLPAYAAALDAVLAAEGNDLLVAVDGDEVLGTMQLTRIPGMARRGTTRLLVEAVRVRSDRRSAGIGGAMLRWVQEDAARALDAGLVQLTSDAAREDAHRFYERLGFVGSHVGFKYRPAP